MYEILGIGNAVTDILVEVDNNFISKHDLSPGTMKLVNEDFIKSLSEGLKVNNVMAGGSVANTLSTISSLGGKCAFIGSRKNDKYGKLFTDSMSSKDIKLINKENVEGKASSVCLVLITPDGERTMCTYLGASNELKNKDIQEDILKNTKLVYLEGYLFDLQEAKDIFYYIVNNASHFGYKVALSLSDSFCVDRHREDFLKLINKNISILFSNTDEIESLYECERKKAMNKAAKTTEIVIATMGKNGSSLYKGSEYIEIDSYEAIAKDTTGAGDNYAAGFLHSFIQGNTLKEAMLAGSFCAAEIVKIIGARQNADLKDLLNKQKLLKQ